MAAVVEKHYTIDQYFALEARSERKHEYYNGRIYLMALSTVWHSQISVNIGTILNLGLLDHPAITYGSNL